MRFFTVQEANDLIPVLEYELQKLRPLYLALKARWQSISTDAGLLPTDPAVREKCLQDEAVRTLILQVDQGFRRFRNYGVECREVEEGIVDFPFLLPDRIAFLSWAEGDDCVGSWHEMEDDIAERRPLIEACSRASLLEEWLH